MAAVVDHKPKQDLGEVLRKAGQRALGGGIPGAAAMGIQVVTLMPLRTTMNYQYRHGTSTTHALKHLYNDGGIRRFYRGVLPALFQGPMSRFGDTASYAGVIALLDNLDATKDLPIGIKTICSSAAAASFRIFLMPVDALKTTLQVEGARGLEVVRKKLRTNGIPGLYHGALAASAATFAGSYPWFTTYKLADSYLPQAKPGNMVQKLMRSAVMGFVASAVSDTVSNSIRVIKTTRQTSEVTLSYVDTVKMVVKEDGVSGLFFRGLKTRILANALQGMMFSVLWRALEDQWKHRMETRP